jgi:hypothetical protein
MTELRQIPRKMRQMVAPNIRTNRPKSSFEVSLRSLEASQAQIKPRPGKMGHSQRCFTAPFGKTGRSAEAIEVPLARMDDWF